MERKQKKERQKKKKKIVLCLSDLNMMEGMLNKDNG